MSELQVVGKLKALSPDVLDNIKTKIDGQEITIAMKITAVQGPPKYGADNQWKTALRIQSPSRDYIVICTLEKWYVFDYSGKNLRGSASLDDVKTILRVTNGVKVGMADNSEVTFSTFGAGKSYYDAFSYALFKSWTKDFESIPHQKEFHIDGQYIGGFGTSMTVGSQVVIHFGDRGIGILGSGLTCLSWDAIAGLQIGGIGQFQTGGGFIGGGFGISGALKGIALASVMNSVTTRTHIDCLLRIVMPESEITIAPQMTPQGVELNLSAAISYLRKKSGEKSNESTLGVHTLVSNAISKRDLSESELINFCTHCGQALKSIVNFCSGCGEKIEA